jgi:DNA (cytosine-5)-methyltransferase 1
MGTVEKQMTSSVDVVVTGLEERGIQLHLVEPQFEQRPISYRKPKNSNGNYIFSFFSGCGFLDLGFEKAGFEVVLANEVSAEFTEAHHYSRSRMRIPLPTEDYHQGSIHEFTGTEKEEWLNGLVKEYKKLGHVGFIGGPPCPDFSVGGKNKGKDGERGQLTKTYFELIVREKPDWFMFENVKGLWSTKKHREFYDEMRKLVIDNGYAVSERLINSLEYGVPQDRERIILIGFRGSILKKQQIIPGEVIPESKLRWTDYTTADKKELMSLNWPSQNDFGAKINKPKIRSEFTVEYWFNKNDVENHLNARHCFTPRQGLVKFQTVKEGDDSRKSYKRLHRWRYSPTACYGNNEVHLHPTLPRRISVAEALALQSLPKEFTLPPSMTLSAMFKTIGNGVPFLAAKAIANMIRDFTNKKK